MSASDKLDLTQFHGHTEIPWQEVEFVKGDANRKLLTASPVLLAKLREAVGLLRERLYGPCGNILDWREDAKAFLATIHTGDQTNERE